MSSNNNDQIKKIDSLLFEYLEPNTKILKHSVRLLTAPGENYGSVMQAVDITIQEPDHVPRVLHLVAKRLPANEFLCEIFNIQETFKKEIRMYLEAVPALAKFQDEHGNTGRKFSDLFAKSFGARINLKPASDTVDDDAVLLLENLKIMGFDTADRLLGFNEEEAYRILEDLARFHAVPIAFRTLQPEKFKKYVKPALKGVKIADNYDDNLRKLTVDEVLEVLKVRTELTPYFDKIAQAIYDNLDGINRMVEGTSEFATINHTDYWVNNTMLLRDELGKPIENKMLDFQIPVYNSGVRDLLFFLYTSVRPTILNDKIDSFIQFYYNCFVECLQEFKINTSDKFSWANFEEEIKNNAVIELGHILIMLSPIFAERGTISDMSDINPEHMMTLIKGAEYENRVVNCILSYIKNKWL